MQSTFEENIYLINYPLNFYFKTSWNKIYKFIFKFKENKTFSKLLLQNGYNFCVQPKKDLFRDKNDKVNEVMYKFRHL